MPFLMPHSSQSPARRYQQRPAHAVFSDYIPVYDMQQAKKDSATDVINDNSHLAKRCL